MFGRDRGRDHWEHKMTRLQEKMEKCATGWIGSGAGDWFGPSTSGNRAFDDYREETLKRLEEEQREFKDFLARLRFARDRSEFDQFMTERRGRPLEPNSQASRRPNRATDVRPAGGGFQPKSYATGPMQPGSLHRMSQPSPLDGFIEAAPSACAAMDRGFASPRLASVRPGQRVRRQSR